MNKNVKKLIVSTAKLKQIIIRQFKDLFIIGKNICILIIKNILSHLLTQLFFEALYPQTIYDHLRATILYRKPASNSN
jgi:hypothetical protein